MAPAVSVIIAAYNAESCIGQAIASVLAQTMQDFEIIVADDGSADRTADVVRRMMEKDVRIRLLQYPGNRGPSFARNLAIRHARGRWIAVLDADDWWRKDRLQKLMRFAELHRADMVADDLLLFREGRRDPGKTYFRSRERVIGRLPEAFRVDARRMIRDDYGYLKPIVSAAFIRRHGLAYEEDLRCGEDFRFMLECLMAGATFWVMRQPLYCYRIRRQSLSSDPVPSFQAQIRSTKELIRKYQDNKVIAHALKQYLSRKRLYMTEARVRHMIRERRFLRSILTVAGHPVVLRPLIRRLVR